VLSRKANLPKIKGANNIRPGASPQIVIAPGAGQAIDHTLDQCTAIEKVDQESVRAIADHFSYWCGVRAHD
jgi:hypothetical protein